MEEGQCGRDRGTKGDREGQTASDGRRGREGGIKAGA